MSNKHHETQLKFLVDHGDASLAYLIGFIKLVVRGR